MYEVYKYIYKVIKTSFVHSVKMMIKYLLYQTPNYVIQI